NHLRKLSRDINGDKPSRPTRNCGVDAFDSRMRMRRAHEGDMHHARKYDVADILAAALGEPRQIRPRHRAADIGIRPVEGGKAGRLILGDFHGGDATIRSFPRKRESRKEQFGSGSPPSRGMSGRATTKTASATSACATYGRKANRRSRDLPRADGNCGRRYRRNR